MLFRSGKYVIFHDADCYMDSVLLHNAAKYLEDYPIDGLATRTTNTSPKNWIQRAVATQRAIRWENTVKEGWRPLMLDKNSGINVAIMRRDIVNKLGGFNEKIFYFEDNDLTKRFFEAGYDAMFGPSVIQYHNDPLTLKESIGQCKSIAKGMRLRKSITNGELVTISSVPINIFTGIPGAFVFLYFAYKSKDIIGSFYFSVLWTIRSAAKGYYYLFGKF